MDGLLINSEDRVTLSINQLLEKHGRPLFTPSIRAQLMGVPDSCNSDIFHDWAKLPISRDEFARESREQMSLNFPSCKPLPGAEKLLLNLSQARIASSGEKIELALASSTKTYTYELKISNPQIKKLLNSFRADRRIFGEDSSIPKGRGKPAPDICFAGVELFCCRLF